MREQPSTSLVPWTCRPETHHPVSRDLSSHSMAPGQGKNCTCTCTCRSCAIPTENVSRKKNKKSERIDFLQGQILHVPLHAPNMNHELSWGCPELTLSTAGPVHSKCRFVVVFRIFRKQMECLPIYTHGGKGVASKHYEDPEEWIAVKDARWARQNIGESLFVRLNNNQDVRKNAHVHITESVMVERAAGDVRVRGMMEGFSLTHLHRRRAKLDKVARQVAFEEDCVKRGR